MSSTLRKAVDMGFRSADAMRADRALQPSRGRPGFRLLLMDLAMPVDVFAPTAR
jgi:hypothetical protein